MITKQQFLWGVFFAVNVIVAAIYNFNPLIQHDTFKQISFAVVGLFSLGKFIYESYKPDDGIRIEINSPHPVEVRSDSER